MKKYCIAPENCLSECLQALERAGTGILIAVDEAYRLIGTISDGDIRRALINGCRLEAPVGPYIRQDCYRVSPEMSRNEVLDMMQARWLEQVPIVDENGKVLGLHLLHDLLGKARRPNWALIMAGGEGKRLRPLTERTPKPMIEVAGRPILERIVLILINYGIRRIFISVNHLAHMIENHFGNGSKYGATIEYLYEDAPLGSGGAISLLPEIPEHALLVMNGDLIVDINCAEMIDFHSRNSFYATMGVYSYFHQVPYGCVEVQHNRLVAIQEKPIVEKKINAGIYVLSKEAVSAIPKNTYFPATALFEHALKENLTCGTFLIEKNWLDIGVPQQLRKAWGEF